MILLLDGEVWHRAHPIIPELARRISAGAMPPLTVSLLESGGPQQRMLDYEAAPSSMRSLLEFVPSAAGQSLGGLFTALATTRFPDLVAGGVAQSLSLWWPTESQFGQDRGDWFRQRAAAPESSPLELHWGVFEWVLEHDVALATELLRTQGTLVSAPKGIGGHDALWWQALLPGELERVARTVLTQN